MIIKLIVAEWDNVKKLVASKTLPQDFETVEAAQTECEALDKTNLTTISLLQYEEPAPIQEGDPDPEETQDENRPSVTTILWRRDFQTNPLQIQSKRIVKKPVSETVVPEESIEEIE